MEYLSRGVLLEDTKLLALSSSVAFVPEGYVRVQKAHDSFTIRVPHWKIIGFAYEGVRNQNTIWSGIFLRGTEAKPIRLAFSEQEGSSCATSVK